MLAPLKPAALTHPPAATGAPGATPAATASATPAVAVQSLSLSFDGIRPVLDRVSLTVAAGELVALVGHNDCGKTTLLNLCAGLVDVGPSQGQIALCGAPVHLGSPQVA